VLYCIEFKFLINYQTRFGGFFLFPMRLSVFLFFLFSIYFSCKTAKTRAWSDLDEFEIASETSGQQSNVVVPSAKRLIDLNHLDLTIEPDWDQRTIEGKARYVAQMGPRGGGRIFLHAKGMVIRRVLVFNGTDTLDAKFNYNSYVLEILLERIYRGGEEIQFQVDYLARPHALADHCPDLDPYERGFYFINPDKYTLTKPKQCWTQNEPEAASIWFPTFDVPNQQFTHSLRALIPAGMVSLSNGIQKPTKPGSKAGTEWHHWEMNLPHAPYLVMFAAGPFAIVEDRWQDIPVHYYTDSAYSSQARQIFRKTPEMLDFFSKLLKTPYPWPKYHQVCVRDFTSGAMENTTAVVFGEFVQKDSAEMEALGNELIVAHEMFHHWFGDLVTCESWANLPLNESFANYSEYLWLEHAYGREIADQQHYEDLRGYLYETYTYGGGKIEPLIRYANGSPHDMFDSHSYNKGGRVLHMLRRELGDSLFFEGLRVYLSENRHQPVEIHHLRLALEKVSGTDLMVFFNQWFLTKGHPSLNVNYSWNPETKILTLALKQEQIELGRSPAIFRLDLTTAIYLKDTVLYIPWSTENAADTFRYSLTEYPLAVDWDHGRYTLAESVENTPLEWCTYLFRHSSDFLVKMGMLEHAIETFKGEPAFEELMLEATQSKFVGIRVRALEALGPIRAAWKFSRLRNLAFEDSSAEVRLLAAKLLSDSLGTSEKFDFAQRLFSNDLSHEVKAFAVSLDPTLLANWTPNPDRPESVLILAQAQAWVDSAQGQDWTWYRDNFTLLSDPNAENEFLSSMGIFLTRRPLAEQRLGFAMLKAIFNEDPSWIVRLGVYDALYQLMEALNHSKDFGAEILAEEIEATFLGYIMREKTPDILKYLR
jgi:aminopeptidase N